MDEQRLTLRRPGEVVVRMYGQGFGDCFLLALPRMDARGVEDPTKPVYVLIDSGVFFMTPQERQRMRAVARSVAAATDGVVDLLVATHEHYDHLSGFAHAAKEWQSCAVRRIWLAWTEQEDHPATIRYDREREALRGQIAAARALAQGRAADDPALGAELRMIESYAGFLGAAGDVDEADAADTAGPEAEGQGAGAVGAADDAHPFPAPRRVSKTPDAIMDDFAKNPGARFRDDGVPTEREFCEPGEVRAIPETAVDAYVLGPPVDVDKLGLELDESEVYPEARPGDGGEQGIATPSWAALALAAASARAERLGLAAAIHAHAEPGAGPDPYAPFRSPLRLSYGEAREQPFFQEHYFGREGAEQIENEWLRGVGRLALQLDNLTNNTSLVLAFRLPDGRVLLFAGDAQVGNWLSWANIAPGAWRRPGGGAVAYRPTANELLARAAVYKVGHHGSRNATLQARGLELMPDQLIALIPTSRRVPQEDSDPAWDIPLPSLLRRLKEKCGGQVLLPHDSEASSRDFLTRVEASEAMLPAMVRKGVEIEPSVHLWRQVRI
jgi:hypothetical protein